MRGIRQANLLRSRKFPTCELKQRQVRNLLHDSRNARANLHVSTQAIGNVVALRNSRIRERIPAHSRDRRLAKRTQWIANQKLRRGNENWRGGGCFDAHFKRSCKERSRSFGRASRIVLAGIATDHWIVASTIKTRV